MPDHKSEPIDWRVTTFAGNRQRQHQDFRALSFREKLAALEDFGEVSAFFASRKAEARGTRRGKPESGHNEPGDR